MTTTAVARPSTSNFSRFLRRTGRNFSQFWRQLSRNKLAVASLALVLVFALVAIFADLLYEYDFVTSNSLENALLKPGESGVVYYHEKDLEHTFILGSDNYGRDILGRLVHGARVSMIIGFATVAIALFTGGILGALAGYKGGLFDTLIMRATDILLSIPTILLAIAIVAALGNSFFNLLIAISMSMIPGYIRIVRASIITVKDQEFVEAARCIGAGDLRIVLKHILPNITSPHHRTVHIECGFRDQLGCFPLLPRSGHTSAQTRMGQHALRSEGIHPVRTPSPFRPRPYDPPHRTGLQPHRRRASRRPRPETQAIGSHYGKNT